MSTETVKLESDGASVEVTLNKCGHCGKQSTAEDAERALKHERDRIKACAVCGEKPPSYPRARLWHSSDQEDGREGWIICGTGEPIDPTWNTDWCNVSSFGPAGTVNAVFHVKCLKRVAPGVQIDAR
jgi:hypothetical protein